MTESSPPIAAPQEGSLLAGLLESLSRLPLRLLQFPLAPIALAGISSLALFTAFPEPAPEWGDPLRHFFRGIAIVFGAATLLAFWLWGGRKELGTKSALLSSGYLRQILALAMLWQLAAAAYVLYSLGPWLAVTHELFENVGGGDALRRGDVESGFAAFTAVLIYFCPGTLVISATAAMAAGIAIGTAALQRSRRLPRVLLVGAIVQAAYWGGAGLSLELLQNILRPVMQRMESVGVEETMRERPESLEAIDPRESRALLVYMTLPYKRGRPAVQQLGWLLAASWLFIPAVFVRRSTDSAAPARVLQAPPAN